MAHGPAAKLDKDNASDYKTRLGVKFFIFYALVYAFFVGLNCLSPSTMEMTISGINLAVFYGMGLIALALAMALVYNHLCTGAEKRLNG